MIRDKDKVYGEPNDEVTVTSSSPLTANKYIVSESFSVGLTKPKVKVYAGAPKSIMLMRDRKLDHIVLATPNRLVGTDGTGKLVLFERNVIPDTPPPGRIELRTVVGSSTPEGSLGQSALSLSPGWYEIEVEGAGGGGGAGATYNPSWIDLSELNVINGTDGGQGGYYKGTFVISTEQVALLQAGCGGGGGNAYRANTKPGNSRGGKGGRTPILYAGSAGDGGPDIATSTNHQVLGGVGINGGANGGSSRSAQGGGIPSQGSGGGGGGANGPYGGAGGYTEGQGTTQSATGGAGGGAGGGFGIGGKGGNSNNVNTPSVGAGDGGNGLWSSVQKSYRSSSVGGGGGGGGSRFKCGTVEVLCGGGGGGAGGGASRGWQSNGGHGSNNMNTTLGGGGNGGRGGIAHVYAPDGFNGQRGRVRLWRCI